MKKLTGQALKDGMKFIEKAAEVSQKSKCKKSHRGVIIVKDGQIIGEGYNNAPGDQACPECLREAIKDNSHTELCYAVHAEQKAIIDAFKKGHHDLKGSRMYHIKVKNGQLVPSDDISCTICSRLILESGISEMTLLHTTGLTVYTAEEFNNLSFQYFNTKSNIKK